MKRVGFRGRLFFILLAFALVPSILISLVWSGTGSFVLPLVGATAAWDSVAGTGERAIASVRSTQLSDSQRRALDLHDETLKQSRLRAGQIALLFRRAAQRLALATVVVILIIGVIASRVAGHLSRNLSRPLQELVGWTERIGQGEPLPTSPPRRGAPEFEVLRGRMRHMSAELDLGRARALEAERSAALRESARQVAHELKNPLTPIRFAVERLRRDVPPELAETVEVLSIESKRLEAMAKSFAQFGRLPEGPRAEIDVGELVRYTARASIPPDQLGAVNVDDDIPMIHGHHDALARALSNVMLNAVDACGSRGHVAVRARQVEVRGNEAIEVTVSDTGCGIPHEQLARIWDPYVTSKPGGTGLGLAIARQTVLAHNGTVSAESTFGSGTSIRFVLPVNGSRPEGGTSNGAY
ncbi:MAG: HAMP domain-containing sensor histidine kinase [Gemmatimonadaceae bacterium]